MLNKGVIVKDLEGILCMGYKSNYIIFCNNSLTQSTLLFCSSGNVVLRDGYKLRAFFGCFVEIVARWYIYGVRWFLIFGFDVSID